MNRIKIQNKNCKSDYCRPDHPWFFGNDKKKSPNSSLIYKTTVVIGIILASFALIAPLNFLNGNFNIYPALYITGGVIAGIVSMTAYILCSEGNQLIKEENYHG